MTSQTSDQINNSAAEARAYLGMDSGYEKRYMEENQYRFAMIERAIPRPTGLLRILDIGTTPFTLFLKQSHSNYDIYGLDRTDHLATRWRSEGVKLLVADLDTDSIPIEDEFFDVVIFTEVLEHVFAPPTDVLRRITRKLKRGGKLIISVPNIATLLNRLKLLMGETPLPDPNDQLMRDWMHGHGHLHEYTKRELRSVLKSAELIIETIRYIAPSPRLYLASSPLPVRGLKTIRFIRLVKFGYHTAVRLVPAFRPIIYAECRRASE